MLKTNEARLVKFKIQGGVIAAYGGSWRICHDGVARMVPAVGGITLNFKVGDRVNALVGDHLEPAVSCSTEGDPDGKRKGIRAQGFQNFSCVGNTATVLSGAAKGATGTVTGHHGGAEHVMIDFDDETLDKMTNDDKIQIVSHGVGLEIEGFECVKIFSMDPRLLQGMGIKVVKGKLEIPVARKVPAVVMGSGIGGTEIFRGDYDIQTSDPETNKQYELDTLRLGDLVAIIDHDAAHGWSYKRGAVTIGVIIHGDSMVAGHGPGVQTLMTCHCGKILPKVDDNANIGRILGIGRWRPRKKASTRK
jgi:hypothetical protein